MNIDDVLVIRMRKAPSVNRKRSKPTPEQKMKQNIRYIIRIIRRGEFKPGDKQHEIKLHKAIQMGYVDKQLNIIREP